MSDKSLRTCVGCREVASPDQLVRVAVEQTEHGPEAVFDVFRRIGGRGAWVHPTRECVSTAVRRRAFHRAFRTAVSVENLGHHLNVLLSTRWNGQKESESEDHGKPMSAKR